MGFKKLVEKGITEFACIHLHMWESSSTYCGNSWLFHSLLLQVINKLGCRGELRRYRIFLIFRSWHQNRRFDFGPLSENSYNQLLYFVHYTETECEDLKCWQQVTVECTYLLFNKMDEWFPAQVSELLRKVSHSLQGELSFNQVLSQPWLDLCLTANIIWKWKIT